MSVFNVKSNLLIHPLRLRGGGKRGPVPLSFEEIKKKILTRGDDKLLRDFNKLQQQQKKYQLQQERKHEKELAEERREHQRQLKEQQKKQQRQVKELERQRQKQVKELERQRQKQVKELEKQVKLSSQQEERRRRQRERRQLKKLFDPNEIHDHTGWEEELKWAEEIAEHEAKIGSDAPFEIIKIRENSNAKFTTYFDVYRVKVNKPPVDTSFVFRKIVLQTIKTRNLVEGDKIRLIISHPTWAKPISTKLVTIGKGNSFVFNLNKTLVDFAEYKEVPLDELTIEVQSTKIPRGSGRLHLDKHTAKLKKSIITIKNKDTMCAARAIVTALANVESYKWKKTQLQDGFNKSRKLQTVEAQKLHEETGVTVNEFGSTLEDIDTFAKHLDVQINILDGDQFNDLIYKTEGNFEKMIYLYKNKNHFDVITSMPGFLCKDYYCHTCKKSYSHRDKHRCPTKCLACFKSNANCCGDEIVCDTCNRIFYGKKCYDEHLRDRSTKPDKIDTVCGNVQKCLDCKRCVKDLKTHVCGHSTCSNCKEYCDMTEHKCFMKWKETKGGECTRGGENDLRCDDDYTLKRRDWCLCCKTRTTRYIFYDFETQQDTGTHIVNYVHMWDYNDNEETFTNIDDFCFKALNMWGSTFIAHNGKAFDMQFILKWCVENGRKPYCIYNGTKIMYMSVSELGEGCIRFIDSINFVNAPLSSFPKTFGLKELKKGFFPHYFNTPGNQNYIGPMPDKKYYDPDQMSSDKRKEFMKWYEDRVNENYVFNFQKELVDYCRSDVDILRRSMMKFREDFLEIANIDPLQYITIASVCMNIYRNKFMPKESIAVVKDVPKSEVASEISLKWLQWISETQGVNIKHALNGGEYKIEDVGKVDGYCKSTNTVYEFQGCFWHGCTNCYKSETINPCSTIEMGELNRQTQQKSDKIRNLGYNLVEVWECELKKDSKFKEWCKTHNVNLVQPLDPRDAFFGGRTNVTKLKYDFKPNERGQYVDFVSLYPTVQYFKKYPVGHPTKIMSPKEYDPNWFGYIKCRVLAPRGLYHPVLPVKTDCKTIKIIDGKSTETTATKLLFPLCRTCGEHQSQTKCNHTDNERAFIGTWCTNEMKKAMEMGYKVLEIYEVWHFEETSNKLFRNYVKTFMKLKMESSDPPEVGPNCTYKSIDHFKSIVKERLGIELGEIKKNPGMRAIAKLCLNSLWGKFGQRINMKQTLYVTNPAIFYKVLLSDSVDNLNIQFINDDMVQMNYDIKDKFVDNHNNVNIFIASFTTSHARMMLYDVLDKVGDRCLGYDTDSCWYVEREGEKLVETGDSLGDLTDELGSSDYITEWVATGPKSYSYKTHKGKSVCKVKGFTLNFENSQHIQMDSMSKLIDNEIEKVTIVKERAITRDRKTHELVNKYQEKDFKFVYNKRVIQSNFDTVPYGY